MSYCRCALNKAPVAFDRLQSEFIPSVLPQGDLEHYRAEAQRVALQNVDYKTKLTQLEVASHPRTVQWRACCIQGTEQAAAWDPI